MRTHHFHRNTGARLIGLSFCAALMLSGATASAQGEVCTDDTALTNLGNQDFRVKFSLNTTQGPQNAQILSQRQFCGAANSFWDIRLVNGRVNVETLGSDRLLHETRSNRVVNDGQPHDIVVERKAGVLTITIDCELDATGTSSAVFDGLFDLQLGVGGCVGSGDGTQALANPGDVTNVCVSRVDQAPLVSIGTLCPTDTDGDGVNDDVDNCPTDANADQADNDLDGQGDVCDADDDNDGTDDGSDGCPLDESKTAPGACGCGNPDADVDGDGVAGCNDTDDTDATVCGDTDGDTCDDCTNNVGVCEVPDGVVCFTEGDGATGSCYEHVLASIDWPNARLTAETLAVLGQSGQLASITSLDESQFIRANFPNALVGGGAMIGAFCQDGATNGTCTNWAWVDGESFVLDGQGFQNFCQNAGTSVPREPNGNPGLTQDVLHFNGFNANPNDGFCWNDLVETTSNLNGYMVEYAGAGAVECPGDGADTANDGTDTDADGICDAGDADDDNDGFDDGDDCAPQDASVNPSADEVCDDGQDNDCDGDTDGADSACDADGDGVNNGNDNCPADANADQTDGDGDGQGDACDACPNDADNDADGDGVCGDVDNCPTDTNADQTDDDNDGFGDVCDLCEDTPQPSCTPTVCTAQGTCINDDFAAVEGVNEDVRNYTGSESFTTNPTTGSPVCYSLPGQGTGSCGPNASGNRVSYLAPSGNFSAFLQGPAGLLNLLGCDMDDTRVATELITTPGGQYTVSFDLRRSEFGAPNPSRHQLEVAATDGNNNVLAVSTTANPTSGASVSLSFDFTAASTSTTLSIRGILCGDAPGCNANQDLGFDNLRVERLDAGNEPNLDDDTDLVDGCSEAQLDADGDGVTNADDNCPDTANADQADNDSDGSGDVCDADDDNDGVADGADNCPLDANTSQADNDSDGSGDVCDADDDNDGVADDNDSAPLDNFVCADTDGDTCDDCASGAFDTNADGTDLDADGLCDAGDPDDDNDGVDDLVDNCPATPNVDQTDTDDDGQGNTCDPDDDNDGVEDGSDANPVDNTVCRDLDLDSCDDCASGSDHPNADGPDLDGDGLCDAGDPDDDNDGVNDDNDNCPTDANADQANADGDDLGDACDACPNDGDNDIDGDSICGDVDNCPTEPNLTQDDADNDGLGDFCDACPADADNDADGDGICGDVDNCPAVSNADQADRDSDGNGDACDSCGDGTVDTYFDQRTRCLNARRTTRIYNRAQFQAWAANPVTNAKVYRSITFATSDVHVETGCKLSIQPRVRLITSGDMQLGVGQFDLHGDLNVGGRLEVRASHFISTHTQADIQAQTVAFEAPIIDERSDVKFSAFYCLEGRHTVVRHPAKRTSSEGDVSITSSWADIRGDFVGAGDIDINAAVLWFHSGSWITHTGDVNMEGTYLMSYCGQIAGAEDVSLSSRYLYLSHHARVKASGNVDISADRYFKLDGDIVANGDISVVAEDLYISGVGDIQSNADVSVIVEDYFGMYGEIRRNGTVDIEANSYYLSRRHSFRSNDACTISGSPTRRSNNPNGCTAQ